MCEKGGVREVWERRGRKARVRGEEGSRGGGMFAGQLLMEAGEAVPKIVDILAGFTLGCSALPYFRNATLKVLLEVPAGLTFLLHHSS